MNIPGDPRKSKVNRNYRLLLEKTINNPKRSSEETILNSPTIHGKVRYSIPSIEQKSFALDKNDISFLTFKF